MAKCKVLFDTIYEDNEEWTNEEMFNISKDTKGTHSRISEYSKRLRNFYHCFFLFNDIKMWDVFDDESSRTALAFQHKMILFLKISQTKRSFIIKSYKFSINRTNSMGSNKTY